MVTEEHYSRLAEQSYWVEKARDDVEYHPKEGKSYYYNKKHTKISSEEISDGREYSLLFLCVKVEVSC